MTDLSRINAGIVAMLAQAFPDIPIFAENIREDITRPSFKVLFGEIATTADNVSCWTRKIPVELVYFAENTDDPKPECYRRQRQLTALLLGAEIAATDDTGQTVYFPVTDVKSGIALDRSDALLYVHFDLDEIGPPDIFIPDGGEVPPEADMMENLNLNLEVT